MINMKETHLKEIKEFLDTNNIEYFRESPTVFVLYHGNPDGKRSYRINYVRSSDYPIAYPKYGIKGVDKNYFFNSSVEAENNNSFNLWIKDFEWINNRQREVLKSYILHAYGKTPHKFYARQCEIRLVDSKMARTFESEHCFYGKRGASLNLGLFNKKERNGIPEGTLLMMYTFGANFFAKNKNIIEVIRVGTLKFSQVIGGSSKLFKHFVENYDTLQIGENNIRVDKIKFYSDYDHNIGNSMDNLGFVFDGYSKGGFVNYWINEGIAKQRQPMKHKWVMEQMKEGRCVAVPNAGVKRFIYNKEEQNG